MISIDSFNQFKKNFPADSLLTAQLRDRAFSEFFKNGLPTKKEEQWKYTNLLGLMSTDWKLPIAEEILLSHEQLSQISKKLSIESFNFVFVNGHFNKTLSDDPIKELIINLEATNDMFNSKRPLNDLSMMTLRQIIKIELSKNTKLDKPIRLLFVSSHQQETVLSQKLLLKVGAGSEADIFINHISLNGDLTFNLFDLSADLSSQARLEIVKVQDQNIASTHIGSMVMKMSDGCSINCTELLLGAQLSRSTSEFNFNRMGSELSLNTLMALNQSQHADQFSSIQHHYGQNTSYQLTKSILNGNSQSAFRGRVYIAPDAQKANSEQLNNNLLLSKMARANSVPQLEIFADDVKAGHGSTTGQMSQEEIFYFLSRGISEQAAVKMIAHGFAKEIIFKIKNETFRSEVLRSLSKKLEGII